MNIPLHQYRGLLGSYLHPQRGRVVLMAVLLLSGIGLELLNPQVIRFFIDTAESGGSQQALTLAAVIFIIVGLTQRALALAANYVSQNVGWEATNQLRADLARHCLRLDMPFHKTHTPGELIERIDGDVTALANFFSQFVLQVLGNAILVVSVLLLLFREDWRAGLALTLYALATLGVLGAMQNLGTRRWQAEREASAEQNGFMEEWMSGTEDIRASGSERYVMQRLSRLMFDVMFKYRSARMISTLTFVSTNFLFVIGYGLGLAVGAYLYSQGEVSLGAAYLIVAYIGMLSGPLENIREQAQDLQRATASIGRVGELFAIRPSVQENPRAELPPGALDLSFEHASFAYDDENTNGEQVPARYALHQIDFHLKAGTVLGLLGRTGSGKTTLSRLLFRLYDLDEGAIRLGGIAIRDVRLNNLRERVGIVTQDVQIFQASVRDNLVFFNRSISDEQIIAALHELGLWEWIQSLPQGLDTQLASGGQSLSAGEAQLLAFARVFLKNPGLVILDEASSRLDPVTERLLEQAINGLMHGRTGIIIAHRLHTVQRADEIMILENGQIIEHGARTDLATDSNSRFAGLLRAGLEEVLA